MSDHADSRLGGWDGGDLESSEVLVAREVTISTARPNAKNP